MNIHPQEFFLQAWLFQWFSH